MKKNLLRICLSLLFLQLSIFNLKAQWVSIPDTNFAAYIYAFHPACMQGNNTIGWQLDTTCTSLLLQTNMDCTFLNLKDITGIQYFDGLEVLNCSANQLPFIPALPPHLILLTCHSNQLTSLPPLPAGLTDLYCPSNQLQSLPALPASLSYLNCRGNELTALPALPAGLIKLDCFNNQLTAVPALPNGLKELWCSYNPITYLPALPDSLTGLWCYYTQITSLPVLPEHLNILRCNDNQLISLPALPAGLTQIYCGHNQLSSVPELPDSLYVLDCNSDTLLKCLPQLNKVGYLDFYNTGVTCLPNYPQSSITSNPSLSSVPLCSNDTVNNPNGCLAITSVSKVPDVSYSIYPNPVCSFVTVSIPEELIGSNLTITDIMGRRITSVQLETVNQKLETSRFVCGVYFVTVENERGRVAKKLVIEK